MADDRFECRCWVAVSSEFRPVETMKQLILDSHKSWELFLNKVFIGTPNYGTCLEKLKTTWRQILEKCHGLPLAISIVGGLLVETQTKSEWDLDGFAFRELACSFRLLTGLKCLRIHKSHNIFHDVMKLPSLEMMR